MRAAILVDAHGLELQIISGGQNFFSMFSPLVMLEAEHGGVGAAQPIVDTFAALGYKIYCLVLALEVLGPVHQFTDSMNESLDLNMFCCKDDKAMRLAEEAFVDNSLELGRCQRVGLLGSALRAGAARQVASDRFGPSAQSARGSNRRFLCQSKPQPKYRR